MERLKPIPIEVQQEEQVIEGFHNHPLMLNQDNRRGLPETRWDPKIGERYPIGSDLELARRAQTLFYQGIARRNGNSRIIRYQLLQPAPELLRGITGLAIDIVAPAFTVEDKGQRKTVLLLEDHVHQPETRYTMGKSSIVQKLLRFPSVDDVVREYLGIDPCVKVSPNDILEIIDNPAVSWDMLIDQVASSHVKLLTGDVTFVGRTVEDEFVAMAMVGTREDFIFDIARTAIRRLLEDYNRVDEDIMKAQIRLTEAIRLPESVWEDADKAFPVDEVICLSPNSDLEGLAEWGKTDMVQEDAVMELYAQLQQNPLYLAREVSYWDVDPQVHARTMASLFARGFKNVPKILYLFLKNPRDPQALNQATSLIKERYDN